MYVCRLNFLARSQGGELIGATACPKTAVVERHNASTYDLIARDFLLMFVGWLELCPSILAGRMQCRPAKASVKWGAVAGRAHPNRSSRRASAPIFDDGAVSGRTSAATRFMGREPVGVSRCALADFGVNAPYRMNDLEALMVRPYL